jgi:branched-chain amino acid transport system permease protein
LTLQDSVARQTEYWRALLGFVILFIVLVFPQGIAGTIQSWSQRAWKRA